MEYDLSIPIPRPPEAVYAVLADIQNYIQGPRSPVPEMEKIPAGPTRVGTRWREVVRLLPFVTITMWTEVADVVQGRRLSSTFHGPLMTGRLTYEIEPTADGSVLRQRETLTPGGPLRLVAGLMDRMLRPRLVARMEAIRDLLEARAA
jgi:hypothetical protein